MTRLGDFVVDADAHRADGTGASDRVGRRGLVWSIAADHLDEQTGEVDDLLFIATKNHGRIGFTTINAAEVAAAYRCGHADAKGYVTVCQREMAYARSKAIDSRVLEVARVADAVLNEPSYAGRDVPSAFPSEEEQAAFDAGDIARADELRRADLARHPIGQAHDLIDRMNESTAAHAARNSTITKEHV